MDTQKKRLVLFAVVFVGVAIVMLAAMRWSSRAAVKGQLDDQQLAPEDMVSQAIAEIEQLKTKAANDTDTLSLFVEIANRYFDIGRADEAIEYYEKALAIEPQNAAVLTDCAIMYSQLEKFDKAMELLRQAIALQPDMPEPHFNIGVISLFARADTKTAIQAWERYLEVASDSVHADMVRRQLQLMRQAPAEQSNK